MKQLSKTCAVFAAIALSTSAFSAPDATGTDRGALVQEADKLQGESRQDLRTVLHLQELARKQKDVIKLNCVNEMLVQIKPQMNLLDEARTALPTTQDPTKSFEDVQKAANSVRQLAEQAAQCVGEPESGNESSNSYTHPDIPDDPFQGPDPFTTGPVEPPGYASPFS